MLVKESEGFCGVHSQETIHVEKRVVMEKGAHLFEELDCICLKLFPWFPREACERWYRSVRGNVEPQIFLVSHEAHGKADLGVIQRGSRFGKDELVGFEAEKLCAKPFKDVGVIYINAVVTSYDNPLRSIFFWSLSPRVG